jgi:hypothetical protein
MNDSYHLVRLNMFRERLGRDSFNVMGVATLQPLT